MSEDDTSNCLSNWCRYVKSVPTGQCFSLAPFDVQKFQPPYVHYDAAFPQMSQLPNAQASPNYRNPALGPYHAMGLNHTSNNGVFMQWPTQSMIYAHSYDQLRHAFIQVLISFMSLECYFPTGIQLAIIMIHKSGPYTIKRQLFCCRGLLGVPFLVIKWVIVK